MPGRFTPLFANLLLALATLLVFSGCPTPPRQSPHVTSLDPIAPAPPISAPVETVTVPGDTVTGALKDRADAVLPEEKLQFGHGKVPLANWAQLCGFTEIRSTPTATPPSIEMSSPGGTLTLFLGQRFAKWNGILLGLGYPPVSEH